jgi:hypothetical protein
MRKTRLIVDTDRDVVHMDVNTFIQTLADLLLRPYQTDGRCVKVLEVVLKVLALRREDVFLVLIFVREQWKLVNTSNFLLFIITI